MATRSTRAGLVGGVAVALGGAYLLSRALPGKRAAPLVTYPPLDVPKPVADRVWIVDGGPISASGMKLPVRMTVIALADASLLLHSPTRFSPALAQALRDIGPVRHLVAPSFAHWTFLEDWQRAFPEATTWAAPGLRERRAVRRSGVRLDADLRAVPPREWGGDLTVGIVPGGAGFSEAYLFHEPSRTLVLTDLVENLEPARLPSLTALLMRATLATRGATALHVRAVLALRRAAARAAIAAMIDLEPERVVFAHGRWFATDGAARLRSAFSWLLDAQPAPSVD